MLAYESEESGNLDIWVVQLDVGQPVNRTVNNTGRDYHPSWSPDGTQIAFQRGGGIFVMPAVGGVPRKVSVSWNLLKGSPQWSPDGMELAGVVQDTTGTYVEVVTLRTSKIRRIQLTGQKNQPVCVAFFQTSSALSYSACPASG